MTARTCQLVLGASLRNEAFGEVWRQDRIAEGWNALPTLISPPDVATMEKALGKADHTCFTGDDVPWRTVVDDPAGHGNESVPADQQSVSAWGGTSGRIYFRNQLNRMPAGTTSTDLYRAYFAKRHNYATQLTAYGKRILFVDHLGPINEAFANETYRIWAQVPKALMTYVQPPSVADDGELAYLGANPVCLAILNSGGQTEQDPGGEFYVGGWQLWENVNPQALAVSFFCSYGYELTWLNMWGMAMLTSPQPNTTLVSLYNDYAQMDLSGLFTGATAGDIARTMPTVSTGISAGMTCCYGDPTLTLPPDTLAGIQTTQELQTFQSSLDALTVRVTTLEAKQTTSAGQTGPGTGSTVPVGGTGNSGGSTTTPLPVPQFAEASFSAHGAATKYVAVFQPGDAWNAAHGPSKNGTVFVDGPNSDATNGPNPGNIPLVLEIQYDNSVHQIVSGFTPNIPVKISLPIAYRQGFGKGTLGVWVDGVQIATLTPTTTAGINGYAVQSVPFTPTQASHTIGFAGSDNSPGVIFMGQPTIG